MFRLHLKLAAGLLTLVCAWSAVAGVSTAAASTPRHVRATTELALLLHDHHAYRSPRVSGSPVADVPAQRPITGAQTTLPVIGQAKGPHGTHWLRVMLPGRPNGLTGWIDRSNTREFLSGWHIVVSLSQRRVWAYYHGHVAGSFQAVVGKPSTPTPTGRFFIEETVIMPTSEVGGPFALALSARSSVFQEFDGGPGQIGIHGRVGLGGTLGQAESHGCMRLSTPAITWLASRVGPGTPVDIYG